jgi:hypothetical protein
VGYYALFTPETNYEILNYVDSRSDSSTMDVCFQGDKRIDDLLRLELGVGLKLHL